MSGPSDPGGLVSNDRSDMTRNSAANVRIRSTAESVCNRTSCREFKRKSTFAIRVKIDFFLVYVPALQYLRNIPEVGAYNSPWKKSYEHRRKFFFLLLFSPFLLFLTLLLCSLYF